MGFAEKTNHLCVGDKTKRMQKNIFFSPYIHLVTLDAYEKTFLGALSLQTRRIVFCLEKPVERPRYSTAPLRSLSTGTSRVSGVRGFPCASLALRAALSLTLLVKTVLPRPGRENEAGRDALVGVCIGSHPRVEGVSVCPEDVGIEQGNADRIHLCSGERRRSDRDKKRKKNAIISGLI